MPDLFDTQDPIESLPRGNDRLFFALFPDAQAIERILRLANEMALQEGLKGAPLLPSRLHVTLAHLGDFHGVPPRIVEIASDAAALLSAEPGFDIRFDRVVSFSSREQKPLVLVGREGVEAVTGFRERLKSALLKCGLKVDPRFKPHVTMLYDSKSLPERAVDPIAWHAGELVLVHSMVGKSKHVHLGRWPLRARVGQAANRFDATEADRRWMSRALELAGQAAETADEVPIGCVLIGPDGQWVAEASNLNAARNDPSAHAEILAMRAGGEALGSKRLAGCTLYVTLEPCAMCAAAMVHARIGRVVFAAAAPKTGAAGSVMDLLRDPRQNHQPEVHGGLMAEESARLLSRYFKGKRDAAG